MPPRLDPSRPESDLIAVRLTADLLAALDAEVNRQRAANPDVFVGRSNVLRGLVRKALLATAPTGPAEAPSGRPDSAAASRPPRARTATLDLTTVRSHVEALRETMSTREVAAAAGVSADTIAKVLRGGSVSAESAAKLVLVQPVEGGK